MAVSLDYQPQRDHTLTAQPLRRNHALVHTQRVGALLPSLGGFFGDRFGLYLEYLDAGNPMLEGDQALLPKVPAGLGGAWSLDNFQVESMSEYYEETGAIYAKTFPSGAE